jgi:Flp pilus assembly protein TadD
MASNKASDTPAAEKTELAKATEYWGAQYQKDQKNPKVALNYARNLRALGQKQQAIMVLQDTHLFNQTDPALNSELGRLALELDQIAAADKFLAMADDPAKPDWRTISARGTVLAKQGKYAEAIPVFERALGVGGEQTTILNNLALAYAMDGQPEKAEELLRKAQAKGSTDPRLAQNLTLVLGLQGRHDEAKALAQTLPGDAALSNVAVMQEMVKPQAVPAVTTEPIPTAPIATAATPKGKKSKADPKQAKAPTAPAPQLKTAASEPDPAEMVRRLADSAQPQNIPADVRPGIIPMNVKR